MNRTISPPPPKRRKLSAAVAASAILPDSPPSSPEANSMRIFSWNINGITPFLQSSITGFFQTEAPRIISNSRPASLRSFLRRHHWPAILFLQEVKIAPSDTKTQDSVRNALKPAPLSLRNSASEREPKYEAHFTLPCDPHNAKGPRGSRKVYGLCSIIREDFAKDFNVNVRTVDWDKEGRVSVVELQSARSKLALFNIYAVNGTENPYRTATGAIQGTRHDRKLAFHRLLVEECQKLEQDGWDIVLAGDFNVAPARIDGHPRLRTFPQQHVVNRADFNAKFLGGSKQPQEAAFCGIDIFREMHKEAKRYTYFPRGRDWRSSCDRVDYFVVGKRLWERGLVRGAGILDSEVERGPSDHVPIWADIRLGSSPMNANDDV